MKEKLLRALLWLLRNRWATFLLLAVALAAELYIWPPRGSWLVSLVAGVAWNFLESMWSAFNVLPLRLQIYTGLVLAGGLGAWWLFKRWFWHIVVGIPLIFFVPVSTFGIKMTVIFWGLLVLTVVRVAVWIYLSDWNEFLKPVHPIWKDQVFREDPKFARPSNAPPVELG